MKILNNNLSRDPTLGKNMEIT